ncbi:PHP domain-containing protein [Priestia aryabhattai]|uniref:PHP domain-containing protein n=1 Tax=Priestia aryabhattai TaxID=412384 RepID=UPI003D2B6900
MEIKVELHTHTKYSHDSLLNKWMYLLMLKIKKINVVAITDHNEIKGAKKFQPFLEKYGIKVILGEEVFSTRGEIIGLFLNKKIPAGLSPRETMVRIKEQGGIVYIPHPYDEKRYKTVLAEEEIRANNDLIDIIEVHNGRNIKPYFSDNQLAIAQKYRKVMSVGSDAHTIFELGRNYNVMKEFDNGLEFYNSLKEARFVKKECLQIAHSITKVDRVIRMIRKGNFNELFRIINKRYSRKYKKASK